MIVADCLCKCRQSAFLLFGKKNVRLFRPGPEEILPVFKAEMKYSKVYITRTDTILKEIQAKNQRSTPKQGAESDKYDALYQREYDALAAEHEKLSEKIRSVESQKKDKADRRRRIEVFLRMLEEQKECMKFKPYTFVALVDKVTIHHGTNELKGNMEFCFRNGMKYNYSLN